LHIARGGSAIRSRVRRSRLEAAADRVTTDARTRARCAQMNSPVSVMQASLFEK